MPSEKTEPRFGLQAHQVFWNRAGAIVCACCHVPSPESDTWYREQWEEIEPDTMIEADHAGVKIACEGCGKQPRRNRN